MNPLLKPLIKQFMPEVAPKAKELVSQFAAYIAELEAKELTAGETHIAAVTEIDNGEVYIVLAAFSHTVFIRPIAVYNVNEYIDLLPEKLLKNGILK